MVVKTQLMNDMIDLETWGKRYGYAIRSIGAAMFDPYGTGIGEEFYCNVSKQSCIDVGLKIDPSTEKWWEEQGEEAQAALIPDQLPVWDAAKNFASWFQKQRAIFPWSQGAGFDMPIIEGVLEACGVKTPWKFYDVRDTRTAYDMGQFSPFSIKFVGTKHHALHDARHQVRCVQASYAKLRRTK